MKSKIGNMKPLQLLIALSAATVIGIAAVAFYVSVVIADSLPSLEQLENPRQKLATRIYSADGELLDHFFIERRVPLTFKDIPKDFVNALIATEDRKFYDHWGVPTGRVFNAFVKNIFAGHAKEGASTLTMQVARNLYLNRESTMDRKIREAITAIQIEKTYTKEEIIELYTNTMAFGRGSFGLQVAAKVYFGKDPKELTTAECAFLVGLLKKPEYYNRRDNYDDALQRRNLVLRLMYDEEFISSSKFNASLNEPLVFATADRKKAFGENTKAGIAPHFVEMIRQNLSKENKLSEYDLYRDGLVIYTTIDSRIQKHLNEALEEYMPEIQKMFIDNWSWRNNQELLNRLLDKAVKNRADYKAADEGEKFRIASKYKYNQRFIDSVKNAATTVQCGVVVLDPASGAILALAGASPKFMQENPDAKYSLNHAVQIKRQPGSSFKPFVYASALMKGLTPMSKINCGPFSYTLGTGEVWSPKGGGCEDGETMVTLSSALTRSINTVSARLITEHTTPGDVVSLAKRMGIQSNLKAVPALSLGAGGEVDPLELTSAYGTFAFNGVHINPYAYTRIEAPTGEVISERKQSKELTDVFDKDIAQQMTYMMQGVVNYGTASRIKGFLPNIDAAGKTGTTNDAADAWFVGYTPQLVCGVWVGFDELKVTFDCLGAVGYGGRVSAPLWGKIMQKIYADPLLPYKQKKFVFNPKDSAVTDNWTPYNLSPSQQGNGVQDRFEDEAPQAPAPEPEPQRRKEQAVLPPLSKMKKPN